MAAAINFSPILPKEKTELKALATSKYWIDNKESEEKDFTFSEIRNKIILPENILEGYKSFAQGAVNLIEKINSENVDKIQIESFADPDFAKSLYLQVGSGAELINKFDRDFYSTNCDHRLDDCVLTTVQANNMPPMPL